MTNSSVGKKLVAGITLGMLTIYCLPVTTLGASNNVHSKRSGILTNGYNRTRQYNGKSVINQFQVKGLYTGNVKKKSNINKYKYIVNTRNLYVANNTVNGLNKSVYAGLKKGSAINLTDEEYLRLSVFAYANIMNETESKKTYNNKTLKEIDRILDNNTKNIGYGSITDLEHRKNLDQIANNTKLANYTLKDFADQNGKGGFVGYAFNVPNSRNSTLFCFRGSEGSREGDGGGGILQLLNELTSEDWIDNFHTGLRSKSEQFEATRKFVEKNKGDGQIYVTGHSKGAANAAYACAAFNNCSGVAYDGYGIGQAISKAERERLKNSGFVNLINQKDPISAILYHPEKRAFVEYARHYERNPDGSYVYKIDANGNRVKKEITGATSGHYVQALKFDRKGNAVITDNRSRTSLKAERFSQLLYIGNKATNEPLGKLVDGIDILKRSGASLSTRVSDIKQKALSKVKKTISIGVRKQHKAKK